MGTARIMGAWALATGLLSFIGFQLTGRLGFEQAGAPWAFWMSNALALIGFLRVPYRAWPLLGLGMVAGELASGSLLGFQITPFGVVVAFANLTEVLLVAALLRRQLGSVPVELSLRDAGGLVLASALVPIASAATVTLAGWVQEPLPRPLVFFRDFYVGDALGLIILGPLAVADFRKARLASNRVPKLELVSLLALLVAATVGVFGQRPTSDAALLLPYVFVPLLMWAGVRLGPSGVAPLGAVFAVTAVATTARGLGPFSVVGEDVSQRVVSLQLFLGIALGAMLLIAASVGDRLRASYQLAEQSKLLQALINGTPDLILARAQDGRVVLANATARRQLGIPAAAGSTHLELPSAEQDMVRAHDEQVVAENRATTFEEELTLGGDKRILLSTRFPVPRELSGEQDLVVCICRDVTERQQLEASVREAQKMEAIGRLAGGIAHDFNNLLMGVLASAKVLRRTLSSRNMSTKELDIIEEAGTRARDFTRRLLTFSRQERGAPTKVDLASQLDGLQSLLERVLGSAINLKVDVQTRPLWIWMDPTQLQQVVVNLVINARDAMPEGGRITVRASREAADVGTPVVLEVADEGHGMDEATQNRLFEPFYTTKGPGKGTGMGLAIVWAALHEAGADVDVTTAPGAGTTFRMTFESTPPPGPSNAAQVPSETGAAGV
jgi:PAS domain S-box-containing protein